jgi:hypothetical protein
MNPNTLLVWISAFFGMFVVGAVTLFILDIFWNGSTGIFTSGTYAANATTKMSSGIYNIFDQMPNVGKLAGVSLIIGVMGLLGVGGYYAYKKSRG